MRRLRLRLDVAAPVALPAVPRLLAGAAEVDITPPPGLPKAGYSRNARDGTGFRTRLRARVLHLRCGTTSLALVACDLLGGSAVLQHFVARNVGRQTDVPLAGLMIGATHTHGAPGQFHGTGFYNRFSSNRAGFDPDWASFLVAQISAGVVSAVRSRQPAVLGWGRAPVHGFTRNRSLPAYRRNPGHDTASVDEAVNPWLDLLRVDHAAGPPLAAMAVFSIHGTAVPSSAAEYNADLWSYLCTRLGDRIAEAGLERPVVGALQGTHGDVTPALQGRAGHAEAARIGRGLGDRAAALYESLDGALTATPDLDAGLSSVSLASAGRPAVGAALVSGARENLTPVVSSLPLFRAGAGKRWSRGPQGAKWVLGGPVQRLVLPPADFPRVWPVQLLRIGAVLLAGVPLEMTIESGRRVADAVSSSLQGSPAPSQSAPPRVVVTSVANEYAGYCTTPPEYSAQFYEGGHTLYGPGTLALLSGAAASLAASLASGQAAGQATGQATGQAPGAGDAPSPRVVELDARRFMPPPADPTPARPVASPLIHADGDVSWSWIGPPPGAVRWHEPLVQVEVLRAGAWSPLPQPGGRVLDDGHGDLSLTYRHDRRLGHVYAVRWYAAEVGSVPGDARPGLLAQPTPPGHRKPADAPYPAEAPRYRFVLLPAADPAGLTSPTF